MSSMWDNQNYFKFVKTVNTDGFILDEVWYKPTSVTLLHAHDFPIISIAINGSCKKIFSRRTYECKFGKVLIIPAGNSRTSVIGDAGYQHLRIMPSPKVLRLFEEHSTTFNQIVYRSSGGLADQANRILREFRRSDAAAPVIIEGLMLEIIGEVIRDRAEFKDRKPPRFIQVAKEYIHEHFAERICLSELAVMVGVHPTHLARCFKQYYGYSIGEYVRFRRVEYASLKLINSERPLAEIAAEMGFFDQSHFTHVFKQQMKMTPSEYRREFLFQKVKLRSEE